MSANISVGREQTTARAWVGVMLNVGEISEIWIAKGPRLRSLCRSCCLHSLGMDWDAVTTPVMVDTKHAPCVLAWSQLWIVNFIQSDCWFQWFQSHYMCSCVLQYQHYWLGEIINRILNCPRPHLQNWPIMWNHNSITTSTSPNIWFDIHPREWSLAATSNKSEASAPISKIRYNMEPGGGVVGII